MNRLSCLVRTRRVHLAAWTLLAVCAALPAKAQVTGGSLSGTVRDETGAVLPGVTVTVRNTDTGLERVTVTNEKGGFHLPQLTLGNHEVRAELQGFQTAIRKGVKLTVGRDAVLELSLKLGELSEQVVVTGEASLVETSNSTVSGLVDDKKIRDLPLNGRSFIELVPLQAGAIFSDYGTQSSTKGYGKKLSIGGTRYISNAFTLDGTDINDLTNSAGSVAGVLTGVETVREFNVILNAYDAQYGRHTGGVINAVTKSGTNEIHGSAFWFHRNDNLDARNFFDRQAPPEFKRNQFGFTAGGPLRKDGTFYFGSYEGLRERLGLTQILNVPSNDMRRGFLPQLGFVGVHPAVKPFLDSYPVPNGRDFLDGRAEHIRGISQPTGEDFYTARVDHRFSSEDTLFGRYTFNDGDKVVTLTNTLFLNRTRMQYLTLEQTHIFSPQWLNTFNFGFSRTLVGDRGSAMPGFDLPRFAFTDVKDAIGSIGVSGLVTWAGSGPGGGFRTNTQNTFQYKDDVFYNRGKHSIKFGVNFERFQANIRSERAAGGDFTFPTLTDFLQARPSRFQGNVPGSNDIRGWRQNLVGLYFHDDLKVRPNVTLNLGLRYEFITVPTEVNGLVAVLKKPNPTSTLDSIEVGGPYFENPSLRNFQPRLGLAWDVTGDGKTAVRGGAGIFDEQILPWLYQVAGLRMPPLFAIFDLFVQDGPIDFPNTFFTQRSRFEGFRGTPQADGVEFEPAQPKVYKWSLDTERQLPGQMSVAAGYSGSRTLHAMRLYGHNAAIHTVRPDGRVFVASNARLRVPAFGRLRFRHADGAGDYHALRLGLNRRFSGGMQFQGSYTYSKSTDVGSAWTGSSDWPNDIGDPFLLGSRDKGRSAFDVRHNLSLNFTYELPFKHRMAGGWVLGGIVRLSTGAPFTALSGANPTYMRFIGEPPDLAPGADAKAKKDKRDVNQWFDPSAFVLPPAGVLGNLGRSTVLAPGVATFDFDIMKNFALTEGVSLQLRSEFFNLFNRANFGLPRATVFDRGTRRVRPDVGRITDTVTTSRQIQLALKLLF